MTINDKRFPFNNIYLIETKYHQCCNRHQAYFCSLHFCRGIEKFNPELKIANFVQWYHHIFDLQNCLDIKMADKQSRYFLTFNNKNTQTELEAQKVCLNIRSPRSYVGMHRMK